MRSSDSESEALIGLEDSAFEAAAVAAHRAAEGEDPRLDRAVDAAIRAAIVDAYRTAAAVIREHGEERAVAELHRRAAALDAGRDPDEPDHG